MLKIIERWSTNFTEFVKDIADNPSEVSHIICDFLQEILYTWETESVSFELLIDVAYQYNIPITIVTPYLESAPSLLDFTKEKYKRINMIHVSTFWFMRTYTVWNTPSNLALNLKKNIDIRDLNYGKDIAEFKYTYISTNNIAKVHRCIIMDLLAKNNLIDKGAIAWRDILHSFDNDRHLYPDLTDSERSNFNYQHWKPKRMFLDFDLNSFHQETVPDQFNKSFMQLVTESDEEVVFFSEKTATPILLNKPFLVAGAVNHHKELNKLGFVNYDEIFDYSFDLEPNIRIRYEMLLENLTRISCMSNEELTTLHRKIFPKLVFNKKIALGYINSIPESLKPVIDLLKNKQDYTGSLNMFL